jgi:hypothetical protein
VSSDKDLTQTYVLEETAITKISSLEELADMVLRQDEEARAQDAAAVSEARGRTGPKP